MSGMPLKRVTRTHPCPVCGRPDWCGVSADGNLCVCMRTAEGAKKPSANGGYVHILRDDPFLRGGPKVRTLRIAGAQPVRADLARFAQRCREAVDEAAVRDLADGLGLSVNSLQRLCVGWDRRHRASTFLMVDASGRVVGIRLRFPNGRKLSVTGGHEGLFIPDDLTYSRLLVMTEGPTDCAALLDLGFDAVGRPSCSGGVRHCVELARAHWPLDVVVVADGDAPGQHGAESLALTLLPYARSVRVIRPPAGIKDVRAWKLAGASRQDVEAAIRSATVRTCRVRSTTHGH